MTTRTVTQQFWAECHWIDEHYNELVEKYANMWVAIADERVIAASSSLKEVEEKIAQQTTRKDIPIIYVEDSSHVYPIEPTAYPPHPATSAFFLALSSATFSA